MKRLISYNDLPLLTLGCGLAGMLLRFWLLSTENDKGFITRGHISQVLLTLLTVAVLALLWYMTRALQQAGKYEYNFPAHPIPAIGTALGAFGTGILSISDLLRGADSLSTFTACCGILAALCLGLAARQRLQGSRASLLLHAGVCLWLMLRLIGQYRSWSADPQLEDYAFQLFALIFAMLAAYHRSAFAADEGKRSSHAFYSLAGVYFCCLSLAGPDYALSYLSLGVWLLTDLCDLTPMPRQFRKSL